jgi:hypothetical protein
MLSSGFYFLSLSFNLFTEQKILFLSLQSICLDDDISILSQQMKKLLTRGHQASGIRSNIQTAKQA